MNKRTGNNEIPTVGPRAAFSVLRWFVLHDHKRTLIQNGFTIMRHVGVRPTLMRVLYRAYGMGQSVAVSKGQLYGRRELAAQRAHEFDEQHVFSILVPLYNTQKRFLRAMIESVLAQTYVGWELCLTDASDEEHDYVAHVCQEYASSDARVRYQHVGKNKGISENTNACLAMAAGDYVALVDHDDMLHPAALFEMMRSICTTHADVLYTDECIFRDDPDDAYLAHYKPDYAPDTLRANNYFCHLLVVERRLLDEVGGFRSAYDGSQDFDLVLRLCERARRIVHIPEILYYWRAHPKSVADNIAAKPYAVDAGRRAVEAHLARTGVAGTVEPVSDGVPIYRIRYELADTPKVSVLVSSWAFTREMRACLTSVLAQTSYPNFELVLFLCAKLSTYDISFLQQLQGRYANVRVVRESEYTLYPHAVNEAVRCSMGEYVVLLDAHMQVTSADWLQEMLMFARRENVGAVGAKLYYANHTIQHAGLGLGLLDPVGSFFHNVPRDSLGYMGRLAYVQDVSAVSAACMMVRRAVWDELGGLNETYALSLGDVDYCMRAHAAGYLVVWTPFAELRHLGLKLSDRYGYASLGQRYDKRTDTRLARERARFGKRWRREILSGDAYYNPNFLPDRQDFTTQPLVRRHNAR